MRKTLILFVFFTNILAGQVYMKLGVAAGPLFSWPSGSSKLSGDFFGVTRASYHGGICNTIQFGEHFFGKVAANYSRQIFSIRQTKNPGYRTNIDLNFSRLELPISFGLSGFFGTLRHREYIGMAISSKIRNKESIDVSGDSSADYKATFENIRVSPAFLVFLAGFEIGTTFKNDASLYFGGSIRLGKRNVYSGQLSTSIFQDQYPEYKGTYASFELTYYLPRYSYWIKKEFTY